MAEDFKLPYSGSEIIRKLRDVDTKANILPITTEEYEALEEPNANTLYMLTDSEDSEENCAVLYTEQNLTEEQKAQARKNIGAGTGEGGTTDPYNDYQSDVPENIGVLNAILNFKQIAEIAYTAEKGALPRNHIDKNTGEPSPWSVGTKIKGLPYSSSRVEEGFVPNFVSLETFMTALKNPNSYLYTVNLLTDYDNQNGQTYYGTVCSAACAYALNIVPNYTTRQWQDIPDMEYVPWQSVYALKLGDTICHHTSGHVVMVTDITRNKRGKIGEITITEAAGTNVKVTKCTPEEFTATYPTDTYAYHRYSKINEVQHIQSPFVAVEDETPMEFAYNTTLIPRKGDKANWLQGVPVEIDLLEKGGYTEVEVYKDDVLLKTESIVGGYELPVDRTVCVIWQNGSMNNTSVTNRIRTAHTPLADLEITAQEGAEYQLFYLDAENNAVSNTQFMSGAVVLNDIAPANASFVRILARYTDDRDVANIDDLASMISVRMSESATAITLPLEVSGLSSSDGKPIAGVRGDRARTAFLLLQNLRIDAESGVEYHIYYYDINKEYLGRRQTTWMSGSAYVIDGKPSNAVYFRLLVREPSDASISGQLGNYSMKIPATIIGGASAGGLDMLVLNDLGYGSYKARLTDGTNHSDWCHWIVVDAVSSAVATGNPREAKVTFSASNAEPLFVKWAGGHIKDGKPDNGTKYIDVLTDEQKANGEAICVYDMGNNNDWQYGEYKIRVAFKTEYGIIHTALAEAITV